jgi:uncharacterized protein YigA (DUF484 family)
MIEQDLRDRILAAPETILEDRDLMQALVAANDRAMGDNVVDMRGLAMQRLEGRLDKLEDTHRAVIAAAYENLAGTHQIHRAVLQILDAPDAEGLLAALAGDVARTLRVHSLRLLLEAKAGQDTAIGPETSPPVPDDGLILVPPGTVDAMIAGTRGTPDRVVTLRRTPAASPAVFGTDAPLIRSQALLRLDLGTGHTTGLLVMGSEDPNMFKPGQGTDLLAFLGAVVERVIRRWPV